MTAVRTVHAEFLPPVTVDGLVDHLCNKLCICNHNLLMNHSPVTTRCRGYARCSGCATQTRNIGQMRNFTAQRGGRGSQISYAASAWTDPPA